MAPHARVPTFARPFWGWGWGVVENQTESGDLSAIQGAKWNAQQGSGVQWDVEEALDTELDAYLDRELLVQPGPEVKPSPGVEKPAERLKSVLSLAAEEEQWLRTRPPPEAPTVNPIALEVGECPIPEHLKPKPVSEVELTPPVEAPRVEAPWAPPPAPLPGLAPAPYLVQPEGNLPVAAVPATTAPNRTLWVVGGVLMGVSIASLLVVGMLWMVRNSLPDRTPEGASRTLPGPVLPERMTASHEPPPPPPAPAANPEPKAQPTPGAIAQPATSSEPKVAPEPSRPVETTGDKALPVARNLEPRIASTKAETVKPRETAQVRRTPAKQDRQALRDAEDPSPEDTQEETPHVQQPAVAAAPAPVVKAAPKPAASPDTSEDDEFDKEFARNLGLDDTPAQKASESKGVKSVWIPPEPAQDLPETLTPQDIQSVVVANQPAIASCIRRGKEATPGLTGGKFVMRWSVYPSGSTYGIAMETQEMRGTALATCIEGLVKDWKFPKHRTQAGPIRFPFTF